MDRLESSSSGDSDEAAADWISVLSSPAADTNSLAALGPEWSGDEATESALKSERIRLADGY